MLFNPRILQVHPRKLKIMYNYNPVRIIIFFELCMLKVMQDYGQLFPHSSGHLVFLACCWLPFAFPSLPNKSITTLIEMYYSRYFFVSSWKINILISFNYTLKFLSRFEQQFCALSQRNSKGIIISIPTAKYRLSFLFNSFPMGDHWKSF